MNGEVRALEEEAKMEIIKPQCDKREYRRIVLDNSLQVLLISDSETDKCAACMEVGIGAFSDPEGLEGLAHFLEHMLFYASEKYPLEDSYSKYIVEHGGSTNAFTASEHTNYYFDVNPDCFEEALDRFVQFFIKPLMSPEATTREIKAVDSEHKKNLLSDAWRMNQLEKHLSSKNHPYHKFSTGSWETLETLPKAKGLDTRQELLKFYKENYSANLMHLVVYAKDSLDNVQTLVKNKFQEILNIGKSSPCFTGQPCPSEHLQILVKTVPIKEGHKLRIVWPITPSIHHYEEGPCRYLGHLIGHEGEGSLFFTLKKLGWATSLSAGELDQSDDFSFFKVFIDLTEAGHGGCIQGLQNLSKISNGITEHVEDIVGLLFRYIRLLQQPGPCEWIFDELSAICRTVFHYQDKTNPINYVVNVATNMKLYPPKDWLVGSSLPSKFNQDVIQSMLDQLAAENVRIFWESTKFKGHTEMTEPWYETEYSIEKLTSSMIQQWMDRAPNEGLYLPKRNNFIPTDLALKDLEKMDFPCLLRNSSYLRLWYKPNTVFSTPKAYVKIDFSCPCSENSPEFAVLMDIFTQLLMDYLNEYAYDAQVAGLYYAINSTNCGFEVTVVGYNHKLPILLETVIEKIVNFEVKPDRFPVIKELVLKEYQNVKFQQPFQQAWLHSSYILHDQVFPWNEKLEVLPYLEAENLRGFYPQMLSRTFLEFYVAGNIESNEVKSMVEHIEDVFYNGSQPLSKALYPSQHLTDRVVKLDKSVNHFYKAGLNPSDGNSALLHYIQVHQDDFMMNVKLQLFAAVAKQPAFHQLRSVEQLGYITALMQRDDFGIRGIQFIIQSSVKGPKHINLRVEAFLEKFETQLHEMTLEEFESNVKALINLKLEKHKNLREESRFYWQEISNGTLKFDRREREVEALKQLTRKDLIDFFDEYVKVGAPQKRALSIFIYGSSHLNEYDADKSEVMEPGAVRIDDIFSFKRSSPLFGSFKGGIGFTKL